MIKTNFLILLLLICGAYCIQAQNVTVEGYVYEEGNRGYLNQVKVNVFDQSSNDFITQMVSDPEGFFTVKLPANRLYRVEAMKDLFEKQIAEADARDKKDGEIIFLKMELTREPGYIFEVTLAPKRDSEDIAVNAIKGALIEVYNNTTKEEMLVLEDHPHPDFKVNFKKGNHYTVLVRKDGYLAKRMEAFVNVEGCILCFEGVGEVRPGVTDNLSNGLKMGTLLANVEMEPIYNGKVIELQNITYDFGKSKLTSKGKEELSKLASIMNDNPYLNVELGSHTDVRGKDSANKTLSEKRANAAVEYLHKEMKIRKDRIVAFGYGESKIKNKCKAGVDCTEAEHAVNRRTEIKILEMNQDMFPPKSLSSLKKEEEFERMILGQDAPSVKSKQTPINEPAVTDIEDSATENKTPEIVTEELPIMEEKQNMVQEKVAVAEEMEEVQDAPTVKESINEKQDIEIASVEAKMDNSGLKVAKAERTAEISSDNESPSSKRKELEKQAAIAKAAENNAVSEVDGSEGFSGYRVVVHFSRFPLSAEHEIYDHFEDVVPYETPEKNILYMIGEFETIEIAEKHRIVELEKNYPNSYVVEFKNGKRIN